MEGAQYHIRSRRGFDVGALVAAVMAAAVVVKRRLIIKERGKDKCGEYYSLAGSDHSTRYSSQQVTLRDERSRGEGRWFYRARTCCRWRWRRRRGLRRRTTAGKGV
jgi:hypothetical protein